jgi:hypothetical protein
MYVLTSVANSYYNKNIFLLLFLRVLRNGAAVDPQRPLNLPWTKKAPLDLFNAYRWAVPTPLGTTGLDNVGSSTFQNPVGLHGLLRG